MIKSPIIADILNNTYKILDGIIGAKTHTDSIKPIPTANDNNNNILLDSFNTSNKIINHLTSSVDNDLVNNRPNDVVAPISSDNIKPHINDDIITAINITDMVNDKINTESSNSQSLEISGDGSRRTLPKVIEHSPNIINTILSTSSDLVTNLSSGRNVDVKQVEEITNTEMKEPSSDVINSLLSTSSDLVTNLSATKTKEPSSMEDDVVELRSSEVAGPESGAKGTITYDSDIINNLLSTSSDLINHLTTKTDSMFINTSDSITTATNVTNALNDKIIPGNTASSGRGEVKDDVTDTDSEALADESSIIPDSIISATNITNALNDKIRPDNTTYSINDYIITATNITNTVNDKINSLYNVEETLFLPLEYLVNVWREPKATPSPSSSGSLQTNVIDVVSPKDPKPYNQNYFDDYKKTLSFTLNEIIYDGLTETEEEAFLEKNIPYYPDSKNQKYVIVLTDTNTEFKNSKLHSILVPSEPVNMTPVAPPINVIEDILKSVNTLLTNMLLTNTPNKSGVAIVTPVDSSAVESPTNPSNMLETKIVTPEEKNKSETEALANAKLESDKKSKSAAEEFAKAKSAAEELTKAKSAEIEKAKYEAEALTNDQGEPVYKPDTNNPAGAVDNLVKQFIKIYTDVYKKPVPITTNNAPLENKTNEAILEYFTSVPYSVSVNSVLRNSTSSHPLNNFQDYIKVGGNNNNNNPTAAIIETIGDGNCLVHSILTDTSITYNNIIDRDIKKIISKMFLIWVANQITDDKMYKQTLGETIQESPYNNVTNYKQFLYYTQYDYKNQPIITDIKLNDNTTYDIFDRNIDRKSSDWLTEKDVKIFAYILQINIIVFVSTDITPSFYPTEPDKNKNKYIAIFNWSKTHFESIRIDNSFIIDKSIGDKMYKTSQIKANSQCEITVNDYVYYKNQPYQVYERQNNDTNTKCIGYKLVPFLKTQESEYRIQLDQLNQTKRKITGTTTIAQSERDKQLLTANTQFENKHGIVFVQNDIGNIVVTNDTEITNRLIGARPTESV